MSNEERKKRIDNPQLSIEKIRESQSLYPTDEWGITDFLLAEIDRRDEALRKIRDMKFREDDWCESGMQAVEIAREVLGEEIYYTKTEVLAQAGSKFVPRAFVQHWIGGTHSYIDELICLTYAEDKGEDLMDRDGKCLGWTLDHSVMSKQVPE